MYYVYARWLLNEGNSSKGGFHGTYGTPSRSATELFQAQVNIDNHSSTLARDHMLLQCLHMHRLYVHIHVLFEWA